MIHQDFLFLVLLVIALFFAQREAGHLETLNKVVSVQPNLLKGGRMSVSSHERHSQWLKRALGFFVARIQLA
jgi:hypothetical protein